MISDFSSLYAGHVDMDDIGYGGVPVNDRSFSDDHLATGFDKAEANSCSTGSKGFCACPNACSASRTF